METRLIVFFFLIKVLLTVLLTVSSLVDKYCQYFLIKVLFPSTKPRQLKRIVQYIVIIFTLKSLPKQGYCNVHLGGPESEALLPDVFNQPPQDDHHDAVLPRCELQSCGPTL